ncbi:MAG: ExbD/TolR family protein [Imperialibacter sp.]|uniref:ExbD/TolR family protein n=1 Tax=Imperialibacter sp. TaxID=2038411 RepID=UPI003A86C7E0
MKITRKVNQEPVNTGSMADIAFLLLIFFLVSTTILQEKGFMITLPPDQEKQPVMPVNDRNLFKISINSKNEFLIQDEPRQGLVGLREELRMFILNPTAASDLAESPKKAIISLKSNRGTDYAAFIAVLDELKGAYYNIYGERVGLSGDEYRHLDLDDPRQLALYEKGKEGIPMNISIAEPNK